MALVAVPGPMMPTASPARRLAGLLVDAAVVGLATVGGIVLLGDGGDPVRAVAVVLVAATIVVRWLPEALCGRTLGKLVARTKVVDLAGNKPSFRHMMRRQFFSSRMALSAYELVRDGVARHDRLSGTRVVSSRG